MRPLRLVLSVWLEVEGSAALLVLPLACGDLAGLSAYHLTVGAAQGIRAASVLGAFVGAIAGTLPLAILGRPVFRAFREWR